MTLAQLEAIYKANLGVGPLEALEAVYTHGYYDGTGGTITATTPSRVPAAPVPTTIIMLKKPDGR